MFHRPVILKFNKKKGFTVIEIIVAIAILGISLFSIAGFFAYAATTNRYSKNMTIATNLAQGIIESEIAKSYGELTVGNGQKIPFSTDSNDPFYPFSKQTNISLIDSNLNNSASDVGIKQISVYVYWMDGANEKNVNFSTIKIER